MGNLQSSVRSNAAWQQARVPGEVFDLGVPLRQALGTLRHSPHASRPVLGRREAILLGTFALVLHAAVLVWLSQRPEPVLPEVPVEIPPMTIEFAAPTPPSEPVVEPPPPEPIVEPPPPPPVVDELAVKPPPKPEPSRLLAGEASRPNCLFSANQLIERPTRLLVLDILQSNNHPRKSDFTK